ncbi:carbohydrate binding domain-containing protein [Cohnella silvisoli]|uniref:Carbohydrate binding domain-containing protein n=1 Tax=Cohnella silvisoli TaxID=2873699 RepID=A0ABV1KRK8_9BACL|nr:carbohydrate binding domain-containing protein [Cohnella silvisoli]MCD9022439.1 carbohydrate binding domain-containing protein [Cohnella silvisoli]
MTKTIVLRVSTCLASISFMLFVYLFCSVTPVKAAGEEFQIGIFFMPLWSATNDTQYDYIRDANINFIQSVPGAGLPSTVAHMNTVLGLANARGIKVQVSDTRSESLMTTSTDADIDAIVNTYKNNPATAGYYIKDEPILSEFPRAAHVYQRFVLNDPDSIPNVNLCCSTSTYNKLNDWVNQVGPANVKYITTDYYPFSNTGFSYQFYYYLDNLRSAGLSNNIKTASYLQSVGLNNVLSRPNADQLRWSVYNYLAYGVKGIYWFTWFQPLIPDPNTDFTPAIMDASGNKTDLYTPIQTLNGEVKQLGPTLMGLTSRDVYFKGTAYQGTTPIPANYFWQPTTTYDQIVSHFANAEGRSYIMVVNRDWVNSRTLSFNLPSKPSVIKEISKTNGTEISTNYSNTTGNISDSFLPGEGKLYAISTDFVLPATTVDNKDTGIFYSGSWGENIQRGLGDYGDDLHFTATNNDYFQYTFTGTGVDFVTETAPGQGDIDIYIDNVFQQTVSTYSSVRQIQQTVYSKSGLTYGTHTIKGVKKTGTHMTVDTLKITPGNVTRSASKTNDTYAGITYSGSGWGYSSGSGVGDYMNDLHYTTVNNDYFQHTFTGTGVDFITQTSPDGGDVDIYIDNVFQQTVSTYGQLTQNWQKCANEGAQCGFSGTKTVRYGANGLYTSGSFTNTVTCNNATFGDPAPGVVKTCSVDTISGTPTQNWVNCANEGAQCSFSGTKTIRYGANGQYNSGSYTGTVACNNTVFGDPINWVAKTCEYNTIGMAGNKSQQAVYSKTGLAYGTHTIKGVKKTGTYMAVDGFNEYTGSNLLANPGFESGTTSWSVGSGGTFTADSVNKRTGTNGGKISGRPSLWSSPAQDVTSVLTANGRGYYNLSGWVKLASGTDKAQIAILISDDLGIHWVSTDYKMMGSSEWTQSSKICNITWTGRLKSASLYVQTEASLADLYLDDLVLSH